VRLFCLPHAGGSAALFHTWPADLPRAVEVVCIQLPGHGNRFAEAPFTRLDTLLSYLLPAMRDLVDIPYAFFGHSMGALVGYEAAIRLERMGWPAPERLFVSSCRPPSVPVTPYPMYRLPDAEYVARLRDIGGIPDVLLDAPEFLEAFLPVLRADFTLIETWPRTEAHRLDIPIVAFGGDDDPLVSLDLLRGWVRHTTAAFRCHEMPGGHFYLREHQRRFLARLTDEVLGL
jgi:medium-chain acyl-[acyl-carrier-protein] hydrolase